MATYRRPPIVEKIIEFRTDRATTSAIFDRLSARLRTDYPAQEDLSAVDFQINPMGEIERLSESVEQRNLRSADAVDTCIIKLNSIGVARSAPYSGWAHLKSMAERAWRVWNKEMNKPRLSRIGARVTNRIDIPLNELVGRPPQDFVSVGLSQLPFAPNTQAFHINRSGQFEKYDLVLQASTTPSPLIDHQSIILDFDLALMNPNMSEWHDLEVELETMNDHLNVIFESCVTDAARELFNR